MCATRREFAADGPNTEWDWSSLLFDVDGTLGRFWHGARFGAHVPPPSRARLPDTADAASPASDYREAQSPKRSLAARKAAAPDRKRQRLSTAAQRARNLAETSVRSMQLRVGDRISVTYFKREMRARVLDMRTNLFMAKVHYLSYSRHFDDMQPLENLFDRVGRGMRADDIAVGTTAFVKWGGGRELYEARVCEMTTPESGALAVRVHYDDFTDDWDQVSAPARVAADSAARAF